MTKSIIPTEEHKIICEKYRAGKTCTELAKEYGISYGPILKILHKYNEPIFYRMPKSNKTKTNFFNENFFFERNERLAYLMGFALADGCLKCNYKTYTYNLRFSISEKDKNILDMFCFWTNFDVRKIKFTKGADRIINNKTYKCKPLYDLIFSSKNVFTQDFSEWGLVPNKTYVGAIPTIKETKLLIPFIIGLIDGDGSLFFTNKKRIFQLTCNKNIVIWLENTLKELGYTGSYKLVLPEGKCWGRFMILRKNDILNLGKILQINNYDFALERKWGDLKKSL